MPLLLMLLLPQEEQLTLSRGEAAIEGTWNLVATADEQGKWTPVDSDDPRHFRLVVTGTQLTTKTALRDIAGTYVCNEKPRPHQITLRRLRNGRELVFEGIYTVEKDRMKFCLAGPGKARPDAFKAGDDIEFAVELKRIKN